MKKIIYFIALVATVFPKSSAGYMEGSGFVQLSTYSSSNNYSTTNAQEEYDKASEAPSEVTQSAAMESSPRPEARPQPAAKITAASAAPAPKAPVASAPAPTKDYTVRSKGTKAGNGEKLVSLSSCGSIRLISGDKTKKNEGTCDPLVTSESFSKVLMTQMPLCIAEGVKSAGIKTPIKKTNVYNAGSLRTENPGRSRLSLHFAARAIDIWDIDVQFTDGTWLKTPMRVESKNKPFYKSFNACWARLTVAAMKKIDPKCDGLSGMIDCRDANHRDHVHLSLPYCPKKSGWRSY